MADYKAANVAGTSWQRCFAISISNPHNGFPSVAYSEEKVIDLGNGDFVKRSVELPQLVTPFDSATVIPLRDPATGELTGQTTTMGVVYATLYSAYMDAALKRDAALAEAEHPAA